MININYPKSQNRIKLYLFDTLFIQKEEFINLILSNNNENLSKTRFTNVAVKGSEL